MLLELDGELHELAHRNLTKFHTESKMPRDWYGDFDRAVRKHVDARRNYLKSHEGHTCEIDAVLASIAAHDKQEEASRELDTFFEEFSIELASGAFKPIMPMQQ